MKKINLTQSGNYWIEDCQDYYALLYRGNYEGEPFTIELAKVTALGIKPLWERLTTRLDVFRTMRFNDLIFDDAFAQARTKLQDFIYNMTEEE